MEKKIVIPDINIDELDSHVLDRVDKDLTLTDWVLFGEKEGVKMYENSKNHPTLKALMGIIKLPHNALTTVKALQGFEHVKHYDDKFKKGEVIKDIDPNHQILHAVYSSGSILVSDRDFVFLESRIERSGNIYILDQSIELKEVPEVYGVTRGHLHYVGWVVKHIDDNNCELTYLGLVDPKGWVPHAIITSVGGDEIMIVVNVKNYVSKLKV